MEVRLNYLKCKAIVKGMVCNHEWIPRKKKVVVCPKCHSYKWNEDKDEK
jgi:Zn finger protein HypA/HybF involved in hydrogenase expression